MEMKKWQPKKPKSQPPLMPDQVIRLKDVIKRMDIPNELQSLKSSHSLTVVGAASDYKLESNLYKIALKKKGMSAWNIRAQSTIRGLPGMEAGRISRDEVKKTKGAGGLVKGHRPEWADLVHYPKMSPGIIRANLRRINGRRVRPHYVFGNDDRQPFFPSGYPWQCIGRVFAWTDPSNPNWAWSGSGALVTRNTILTAGHVAPWGVDPWMVLFVPAYYNGSSTLGSNVYSYVESYWGYNTNDQVSAWDYCVMKLYDPLGDSLGWFGSKTYDDGWNDGNYWNLVGYPGAVASAEQPSWQGGISFHDDDEDGDAMELETDNGDSSPGDSGGPFFAWWDDGWPYIVGEVSGQEEEYSFPFSTEDNNIAAAGSPMVDLIIWAQNNWP
ncbi:MAG: trypsin-like serine protease [candidate division NC10 bacterium]|nr:trypsin-like serine protease [candidate division NC10 bacterium]MDE2322379.1 trypsin-like serine protease [candidate division NC10 bacterium]